MNWSRIKTILIILFLLTDIFLAASIFISEKKETEISPEVLDAATEILNSHNISLDKSTVLPKVSSVPVLQADNAVTDYEAFAKLILGDSCKLSGDNTYSSEKGVVFFYGDSFSFKANGAAASGSMTQKAAQKAAFSFLKALGFNMSGAKVVAQSENGGIWSFNICDFSERRPIFSSNISVAVSADGINSVSGSWFNRRDVRELTGIKSITGLLIDFAAEYHGVSPAKITAVELGYSVFDNENYHKSASLIPVTKITVNGTEAYFMDSRSNEN